MTDPPDQRTLDYEVAPAARPPVNGASTAGGVVCLVVGIPITTIGLAALFASLDQGSIETPAVLFACLGGAVCSIGLRLVRGRPTQTSDSSRGTTSLDFPLLPPARRESRRMDPRKDIDLRAAPNDDPPATPG